MHAMFISELAVMPLAMLAELLNAIQSTRFTVVDDTLTAIDGAPLDRAAAEKRLAEYAHTLTESDLKAQFTLETCFIAHVSHIQLDLDEDDTSSPRTWPHTLSLVKHPSGDIDPDYNDEQVEDILASLDDDISDRIGYCFSSCTAALEKYIPYQGIETLPVS